MEEFKIIKDRMKEAILLDPVIQEHYIRIYLEELEKCNSMDEIPDDLKRYVKMVLVEMQEEKEDIEVQERETEIERQELGIDNGKGIIENAIDKLNNAIDNIDSIDETNLRANGDELFNYIKDDGTIELTDEMKKKNVRANDYKRELRSSVSKLISDFYDQSYSENYNLKEHTETYNKVKKDILNFKNIITQYGIYKEINKELYDKLFEKMNNDIISLQQHEIIQLLGFGILHDYDSIEQLCLNGKLNRLLTRLYTYLYKLDENDEFDKEKVKEYITSNNITLSNLVDDYLDGKLNANEFAYVLNLDNVDVSDRNEFDQSLFKLTRKYKTIVDDVEKEIPASLTFMNYRKQLLISFAKGIDNKKSFNYFCEPVSDDLVVGF